MKPKSAKAKFLARLKAAGLELKTLTPAEGLAAMFGFYAEDRADGCDLDDDGDMLLFEWGTNDWGDGPSFEVSVTRQLTDEDDEPRQLALLFRFAESAGAGIKDGNRWCESPDGLEKFRKFVAGSAALKAVGSETPIEVELRFGRT